MFLKLINTSTYVCVHMNDTRPLHLKQLSDFETKVELLASFTKSDRAHLADTVYGDSAQHHT